MTSAQSLGQTTRSDYGVIRSFRGHPVRNSQRAGSLVGWPRRNHHKRMIRNIGPVEFTWESRSYLGSLDVWRYATARSLSLNEVVLSKGGLSDNILGVTILFLSKDRRTYALERHRGR